MKRMLILLSLAAGALPIFAGTMMPAPEARQHLGEQATVCGTVASGHYAPRSKGQPTFLDFDQPYPNSDFTVVVWSEDRPKFGTPETRFQGQRVCATGVIESYRGKAEMIVREPSQLRPQ